MMETFNNPNPVKYDFLACSIDGSPIFREVSYAEQEYRRRQLGSGQTRDHSGGSSYNSARSNYNYSSYGTPASTGSSGGGAVILGLLGILLTILSMAAFNLVEADQSGWVIGGLVTVGVVFRLLPLLWSLD